MADLLGIDRRVDKENEEYRNLMMGVIPNKPKYQFEWEKLNGQGKYAPPVRYKILTGTLEHKENGVLTGEYSNMYSKERYKFFLDAPFEISAECCKVMKKAPVHGYARRTGRKPMTAQMASESRLRTQQWLKNGCNGFDMKSPISNPMSFWTEQDVLLYIKENNLPICSVYGEIVEDYAAQGQVDGQMSLTDMGIFDAGRPLLKTTGCSRTGCMFCGYGCHREKSPGRFERMKITHKKLYDYIMRGGHWKYQIFNFKGEEICLRHCSQKQIEKWVELNKENIRFRIERHGFFTDGTGLGYREVIDWINEYGNLNIKY